MSWLKKSLPQLFVYSNRPPFEQSGGALQVINATKPSVWIGPKDVKDKVFLRKWGRFATTTHTHNDKGEKFPYDIVTGKTPESLQDDQYTLISNSILWPVAHSMKPNTGDKTIEEIENAYFNGYLAYNQLGQHALEKTTKEHGFDPEKGDKVWVHDYQCDNVPGQIYSRHIPFPALSWLASDEVSFPTGNGEERVNILDTAFFRDLVENASTRTLSTFQRPIDQVNFLMTAAYMQSRTRPAETQAKTHIFTHNGETPLTHEEENRLGNDLTFTGSTPLKIVEPQELNAILTGIENPAKWAEIQQQLLEKISMGKMITVDMFGERTSIMNMPVGQNQEETLAKAKSDAYSIAEEKLSSSIFSVEMEEGRTINPTHLNPAEYPDGVDMQTFLDTLDTTKWVLSVHRNDYTKGTDTKLDAAEKVLAEHKKQGRNDTTFLFILQPTRDGVPGYGEYASKVYRKVMELKAEYGEQSVVVIPQGVSHDAILHLERKEQIRGFMGLGHKDGHDLTVREVVDANSDKSRPIGVITSSGIGASDVLGKDTQDNKGSFVINNPTHADEVASALITILDDSRKAELQNRFEVMKEQSRLYSAKHFAEEVTKAYETAREMKHAQSLTPQGRRGDMVGESPNVSRIQQTLNTHFPKWGVNRRRDSYMKDIVNNVRGRNGGQSR